MHPYAPQLRSIGIALAVAVALKYVHVIIPGRIKALVLRRDSDWFGDRFGELWLPQRSSIATSQ